MYYSIRLLGGSSERYYEVRDELDGRPADNSGHIHYFYVERSYDIKTMRRNAQGLAGSKITVEVEAISERDYNWMSYRAKR